MLLSGRWSVAFACGSIALFACSGGGDGGGGDGSGAHGSIELDMLSAEVRDASCAKLVACDQFENVADCKSVFNVRHFDYFVKATMAGRTSYDAKKARDCVEHYADALCAWTPGAEDPCAGVFTGKVANGAACHQNEECVSGACELDYLTCWHSCCDGVCSEVTSSEAAVGVECGNAWTTCAKGLFCSVSTDPPTCKAAQASEGAACTEYGDCVAPMVCGIPTTGGSGVCKRLPEPGEACDPADGLCASNATYCDPASAKCVERKAAGATCTMGLIGECSAYNICVEGMCVPIPAPGETCTDETGCLTGDFCAGGICSDDLEDRTACDLPK